ncbi:uncharacterized protein PV09_03418 [Verruconis gallopava]|uniref:Lipocalin-like domain-containing protein n=1 Tax=Verruconis gallopava TaxID=253628 RepID=A0A0D2AF10_9PEZI|nr:uncharacterized protein PV09_03418 [Verruconis gallopava]KIW05538.1 hypothetical protein PV09_03418 [Verruconis gallopava]
MSSSASTNHPTCADELRASLVGGWKLESYVYVALPPSTTGPFHPMTKKVQGILLYTPDGYMSAQMQIPGQPKFEVGKASEAQWAECARRYFGYSGPYHIREENGTVTLRHEFRISYRPDLSGDVQIRSWRFEEGGNVLILGSEEPTMVRGELRTPQLRWRKLENNAKQDESRASA